MNRVENSAYFPLTDVQGNIRGYANTSGVQSAYAYYPYGILIDLAHDDAEDSRRWQAKEFDSDINKYYFGARFYDPLFGLWLTPDPAGQFANPYTYGGDPLNYIDPNGESLTAAIAIGAAVGAGIGGAQYWDTHGSYLGSTLYVETYAGAFGAEAYTGYEWGFSGMEGRGLYTGVRAWGVHAEGSSNMGFTWGEQMNASYSIGENGYTSKSLMNGLFSRETWENGDYRNTVLWKEWGKMTLEHGGYMMDADMMQQAQLLDENSDTYYFWGHSDGYVMLSDPEGKQNRLDAAALANRLEQGMYGYDAQQTIQLYACNAGLYKNDFAQQLANNMGVPIIASAIPVEVKWNRNNAMHKLTVTDVKAKWKTFNPSYDN